MQPLLMTLSALTGVAAIAPSTTIIELPAARDTTLYEDLDGALSNGAGQHLFVGRTGQPAKRRALLFFDVAGGVPAGAEILDAELILHVSQTSTAPTPVGVHRVLETWGEGSSDAPGGEGAGTASAPNDATWIHRFHDTVPWMTVGGSFASSPSATTEVAQPGFYTWQSRQLAGDVQAMLDESAFNSGWVLIGNEAAPSAKRLDSRENPAEAMRPVLRLTITPPAVAVPTLTGPGAMVAVALILLASLAATAYWTTRPRAQ